MAKKTPKWRVQRPDDDGVINIVCKKNNRLVCWLHLNDYENKKDALTIARAIAGLPQLMPSGFLIRTRETIRRINRYGKNPKRS